MKLNPLTIAATAYALLSKTKESSEQSEQKALIEDMEPYYDACEQNKIYDAPAAALESAVQTIKDGLTVNWVLKMGFPGEVGHFSVDAEITISNGSEYDMDVVGVLFEPSIGGVQFGDVPGETLLDWIDLERLTGRNIPAGESSTIHICFNYLKMNKSDRLYLRKKIAEQLGLGKKLTLTSNKKAEGDCTGALELVVKKSRTALTDARYITYGFGETTGTLRWVGANFYPGSLKEQQDTIQNSKQSDKYGYLSVAAFFNDDPQLIRNNGDTTNGQNGPTE